jgi:hypothetical protein
MPLNVGSNEALTITTPCSTARWAIQMMARLCIKLRILKLPSHEMDMDDIEKGDWVYRDLKTPYIRIRGLDSKDKIDQTLLLRLKWRSETESDMISIGRQSIEERAARHLSKFHKLTTLWLGSVAITTK